MLCDMHDMYMDMSSLHTEFAAHPSQFFFQVVVIFLQVCSDCFCIASTAGVRSPSSSARHDSFVYQGFEGLSKTRSLYFCILLICFWITVNLSILRIRIRT